MFISTLSQHLPLVYPYIGRPAGDCFLEFVHLVEATRYHQHNLTQLCAGYGSAPTDFQPGVDFRGGVLDEHWRIMAGWIEFEALLSASKRSLDHAWCCMRVTFGTSMPAPDTLYGAVCSLRKHIDDPALRSYIEQHPYYEALKSNWLEWGHDLANMRHYIEHHAPFGGRSLGYTAVTPSEKRIHMLVPDDVPPRGKRGSKQQLKFEQQRTADVYASDVVSRLDCMVVELHAQADFLLFDS